MKKECAGKEVLKLKHLQKLDIKDGDVVVVQPSHPITTDVAKQIQVSMDNFAAAAGLKVKIWLLPADWSLSVVREPKVKLIN